MLLRKQNTALGHVTPPVATVFFQETDCICIPSLPEGFLQHQGHLLSMSNAVL